MRKHYIDNLRSIVILLLFPFHTLRLYTANDPFYIEGTPNLFASLFCSFTSIWFMNLLFLLAGISAAISLQKRSVKQYMMERIKKLFIPFIFGVVLTIPIQTYYAERFHNDYTGSYLEQVRLFFTKPTDLTGYRGGFTPAHLWFLLFLFLISIITLPIIRYIKINGLKPLKQIPSIGKLMLLFFLIYVCSIVDLGGEELGQYTAYFLIGYLILSRDEILEVIRKYAILLIIVAIPSCIFSVLLSNTLDLSNEFALVPLLVAAFRNFASWTVNLALLGIGQRYLNHTGRLRAYIAKNSFSLYFVHQTILITLAFYIVPTVENMLLEAIIIAVLCFLFSVICCEILTRNKVTGFLFGMRK